MAGSLLAKIGKEERVFIVSCSCNWAGTSACNLEIDYSTVPSERILPFQISLNLTDSILEPSVGENQRFCYDVLAVGKDSSAYADLSHLVFGICDEIPVEEIVNITVAINAAAQDVVLGEGGNVELRSADKPDPPTGCPGLKFDFPLDKVYGSMHICFELTVPRQVTAIDVCLFGGGVTLEGLTICGPGCEAQEGGCPVVGYQRSTVCVPVTVTPFAHVGTPVVSCCGTPVITAGDTCPRSDGICHFTISQDICVAVPVEFGARAVAGTPSVQCGEASSQNICTNCTPIDETASND